MDEATNDLRSEIDNAVIAIEKIAIPILKSGKKKPPTKYLGRAVLILENSIEILKGISTYLQKPT